MRRFAVFLFVRLPFIIYRTIDLPYPCRWGKQPARRYVQPFCRPASRKHRLLIQIFKYLHRTAYGHSSRWYRSNHPDCDVPSDVQNRDGYRLNMEATIFIWVIYHKMTDRLNPVRQIRFCFVWGSMDALPLSPSQSKLRLLLCVSQQTSHYIGSGKGRQAGKSFASKCNSVSFTLSLLEDIDVS